MQTPKNLGEVLLDEGLITRAQLMDAIRQQQDSDYYVCLGRILVEMGSITESEMLSLLNKKFGYELVSLAEKEIPPEMLANIPKSVAQKYKIVPVEVESGVLKVAMEDPTDLIMLDNLKTLVGENVKPVIAYNKDIQKVLEGYPEDEELDKVITSQRPGLMVNLFKNLSLPFFMFVPLIIFIVILCTNEGIQKGLNITPGAGLDFDLFLYILLGWGLLSLIIFEVHGLLFEILSRPKKKE